MKPASPKPSFDTYLIEQLRVSEADTAKMKRIMSKLQMLINTWEAEAKRLKAADEIDSARIYSHLASQLEVTVNRSTGA